MNKYRQRAAIESPALIRLRGDDPRLEASDCVRITRDPEAGELRLDRVIGLDGREYGRDNPGARFRFRTDSREVVAHLRFRARYGGDGTAAHNGRGLILLDGNVADRFAREHTEGWREGGEMDVRLAVPTGGGWHDYELVLPYADAVGLAGVSVSPEAGFDRPRARPGVRWLAFGDSVTQGFTASSVEATHVFRVAAAQGIEQINAGIGGRGCLAADGSFLSGISADLVTIAIGVNDWQGGVAPELFRKNAEGLLSGLRAGNPLARVHVITPLWVPPFWKPETVTDELEVYRQAWRSVVSRRRGDGDARLHLVEGTELIDHDATLFDPVAVHPNDAGFAQMAERLARVLR